jgi:DNA repair exonuclease SbcCD ATPase subunit
MINFESIRWVNFLSTGSGGNEIQLNATKTTLITGKNGSGKSAGVTDALCFVLFNKPFRNVNRGQLINSINNKNCLVTVKFTSGGNRYVVSRGMKPNIFEIYENDTLFTKESSSKDYQKILEEQILRYNFKTFTQVVLLGSASFVPFMELPKASRREVIEDVLDIGVFSSMNEILKKELSVTKDELNIAESNILIFKEKVDAQRKIISLIESSNETQIKEINDQIQDLINHLIDLSKSKGNLESDKNSLGDGLDEIVDLENRKSIGSNLRLRIEERISKIEKELEFFHDNETCPVCSQNISSDHKESIVDSLHERKNKQEDKLSDTKTTLESIESELLILKKKKKQLEGIENKVSQIDEQIRFITNQITKLNKSLEQKQQVNDVEKEKIELEKITEQAISLVKTKKELQKNKALQEQALLLLKDNGIKTSIIREYLPVINIKINQYLASMDFFCNFEIDEEFNEVIKSRHRDDFSYASFSQGQKQRIDIAIMFTFREIAKMKNSLNTNILVLDEIFSSSLDKTAVTFLVDMLNSLKDTNTFVVTHHPDEFEDVFDRHIQFKEVNNFSIMKDLSNV